MSAPLYLNLLSNLVYTLDIDKALENSYIDFHSKGINYINLLYTPELAVKVYILRTKADEPIVNPHDHAYNFDTVIVHGDLTNVEYIKEDFGQRWNKFTYKTGLNGGQPSFELVGEERFKEREHTYGRKRVVSFGNGGILVDNHYYMESGEIHTIKAQSPLVIMALFQYKDRPNIWERGTSFFSKSTTPPDTSGLYKRFTKEELQEELKLVKNYV